jgi:hypothetical protein
MDGGHENYFGNDHTPVALLAHVGSASAQHGTMQLPSMKTYVAGMNSVESDR